MPDLAYCALACSTEPISPTERRLTIHLLAIERVIQTDSAIETREGHALVTFHADLPSKFRPNLRRSSSPMSTPLDR